MSCDCNTLVIGEAGPQGPQGFGGIDGTNGTNGINAFTTLTASFTQPNVGSNITIFVGNSAWIALGQSIYISQAGYYKVIGIPSSTSITVTLQSVDLVSSGSTVSSNRQISPSSLAAYVNLDPTFTSLRIGSTVPPAKLTKLLFFNLTTSSLTLSGLGARSVQPFTSASIANVNVGDIVQVSYGADPGGTFMANVQITAQVVGTNLISVFFTNFSGNTYTAVPVNLKLIVTNYILAV
jgi:hypothetical protein